MSVAKPWLFAGIAVLAAASAVRAEKLSKEEKKWLDDVKPLMLAEEEKTFKDLKDKADREEFQKIFWARRDPDLETPANEFQAEYQVTKAALDAKYKVGGTPGGQTDCGRVALLLGEPDQVKKDQTDAPAARRGPETWTFKDRKGIKFKDGQIEISFDENCALPQGGRFGEQLSRLAEDKIAQPNLAYPKTAEGRLVKLADQLPKPTPAMALLKAPRQDFAGSAHTSMFLRSPGGATYVAGLVRVDPGAVPAQEAGGKKIAKVAVAALATDAAGKPSSTQREADAEVLSDGSAVVSYGMALKPGPYTLNVAVLDPKSSKGTVVTEKLDVPAFAGDELTITPLVILREIAEGAGTAQDAMAAFTLGATRFLPNFANVFTPAESLTVLAAMYDAKLADTGKPSFTYSYSILKNGTAVAETESTTSDSTQETPSVGPVPLAKYGPGKYVVRLKVKDNVAGKDYTKEANFEIK
ncbi:MAG: GWxTD domain-containing protein [Vicinamibacteria bacterium]